MLRARKIVGIVILVIGILLLALAFTVFDRTAESIPPSQSGTLALVPQTIGGGSIAITWSGATSTTTVDVYSCTDTSCSSYSSNTPIASGTGASGTVTFSVSSGHGYAVNEQNDSSGVSATAVVTGLSVAALIGIILAIIGVVLFVLPSKPMPAEPEAAEGEGEAGSAAAEPGAEADEGTVMAAPESSGPSPAAGGTARPPIKCAFCGTMNEPWITNCRWCKRPLTSTQK